MFYAALATDYDGTIAHDGLVPPSTVEALRRLKERGKTLILVTGRELPELQGLFPEIGLFDAVVAENGALLFLPGEGETRPLAASPPPELVDALRDRNVTPLSVGTSIVATWSPNEQIVLDLVHELGLEWQIIFNKGAVMCLPPGVNKASGLAAALDHLGLSPINVVGVGDAENDHAFLSACGFSVAVANALEAVKQTADLVTRADHGDGVGELIEVWLGDAAFGTGVRRHGILLAEADEGPVELFAPRDSVLIAGPSGGGKSSLATALIERIGESGAQLAVLDPEGDYAALDGISHLGTAERPPSIEEAMALLDQPRESLVLGLLGVEPAARPAFLASLLGPLAEMRAHRGRPHWLLVDEAHHFLPAEANASMAALPESLPGAIFITVEPSAVAPAILKLASVLIARGPEAGDVVAQVCEVRDLALPSLPPAPGDEELWFWRIGDGQPLLVPEPEAKAEHQRHIRKYAEGRLAEDKSFFFRGADDRLNLRAHNLMTFLDLAEGVDEDTWLHHLRRGDYSRWVRDSLDDEELAAELAGIESTDAGAAESRRLVRAAIQRRYTAPAEA